MIRLTKKYQGGYGLVKVKGNEQDVESPYPNTLKAILECFEALGSIEDILYAPDGTELIPIDRLKELVSAYIQLEAIEPTGTLMLADYRALNAVICGKRYDILDLIMRTEDGFFIKKIRDSQTLD